MFYTNIPVRALLNIPIVFLSRALVNSVFAHSSTVGLCVRRQVPRRLQLPILRAGDRRGRAGLPAQCAAHVVLLAARRLQRTEIRTR